MQLCDSRARDRTGSPAQPCRWAVIHCAHLTGPDVAALSAKMLNGEDDGAKPGGCLSDTGAPPRSLLYRTRARWDLCRRLTRGASCGRTRPRLMSAVSWPEDYHPERASLHVRNGTQASAPAERVWPCLVRPDRWSEYYGNAHWVRHLDGPWPEIAVGSRFRWITFGLLITSVVTECEPHERLAWTWSGLGARGHHGFVIDAHDWGSTIITEETVRGFPVNVMRPLLRRVMLHFHQQWVEGLAQTAAQRSVP